MTDNVKIIKEAITEYKESYKIESESDKPRFDEFFNNLVVKEPFELNNKMIRYYLVSELTDKDGEVWVQRRYFDIDDEPKSNFFSMFIKDITKRTLQKMLRRR